jgi:3-hydroxyisobutyrate dehydrogenase
VLGLGAMGHRFAQRMLTEGHQVAVWNRTKSKALPLSELGAVVASLPAEAASTSEFIITDR